MSTNSFNDTASRIPAPENRMQAHAEETLATVTAAVQQRAAALHLSRGDLADSADIPRRRMGQLWRRANFNMDELWRVSRALDCNPDELFAVKASA